MKTLDLIRNAKDGSYVDFRTVDNQIDSVPIGDLRALLSSEDAPKGLAYAVSSSVAIQCVSRKVGRGTPDDCGCPFCVREQNGLPRYGASSIRIGG